MLASLIDKPFNDPEWLFEIKWDGYRAITEINNNEINLHSRNNKSFNIKFSPIVESLKDFKTDMILDGEVCVVNKEGRADFQLLQNYQKTGEGNLLYYVFDILYYDGYDLRSLPLIERKDLLKKILPEINNIKFSDHIIEDGITFYNVADQQNIEGIIGKKLSSIYQTNKRSKDWLKMKIKKQQEAIIAGFTKPKGSRKNFGALVLGVYKNNEFIYIGHTGGGFKEEDLEEIQLKLDPLKRKSSPFKIIPKTNTPVTWVEPKLICEVTFSEWTQEGLMRHPIFLGLREDKKPIPIQSGAEKPQELPEDIKKNSDTAANKSRSNREIEVNKDVIINGHKLKLSNLNKIFWDDERYTKGDLIEYYRKVSKYILPYLKDRPESLNRHPNGINKKSFFQKDMAGLPPDWIQTELIYSDSNDKHINYLICNNEAALVYMANLGCIEINPWFSRINSLDNPDYFVIDLDPVEISFDKVIETALEVKKILDMAGADSYCKTSGATGLHIYVPLNAQYDYDIARNFAQLICRIVNNRIPNITSVERNPLKRKNKVYLDYLQNRSGQTLASPYSVRPNPGAPVATPLKWGEVKKGLDPKEFNIKNIHKRLDKIGDIFKDVLSKAINIEKCIEKLEAIK